MALNTMGGARNTTASVTLLSDERFALVEDKRMRFIDLDGNAKQILVSPVFSFFPLTEPSD